VNNAWWAHQYSDQRISELRQEARGAQFVRRAAEAAEAVPAHEQPRRPRFAAVLGLVVIKARHGVDGLFGHTSV
jgi:hypothetical protein